MPRRTLIRNLRDIGITGNHARYEYLKDEYYAAYQDDGVSEDAASVGVAGSQPSPRLPAGGWNLFWWLGVLHARALGASQRYANEMQASFNSHLESIFADTTPDATVPGTGWRDRFLADYRSGFAPERNRLLPLDPPVRAGPAPPPRATNTQGSAFGPPMFTRNGRHFEARPAPPQPAARPSQRQASRNSSPSRGELSASSGKPHENDACLLHS